MVDRYSKDETFIPLDQVSRATNKALVDAFVLDEEMLISHCRYCKEPVGAFPDDRDVWNKNWHKDEIKHIKTKEHQYHTVLTKLANGS